MIGGRQKSTVARAPAPALLLTGCVASQSGRVVADVIANRAYRSLCRDLVNASIPSVKLPAAERYVACASANDAASLATNVTFTRWYSDRHEFERVGLHTRVAAKNNVLDMHALWLAMPIERKLGKQSAENDLAVQLRRRYPSSSEYAAYQRGAFDE